MPYVESPASVRHGPDGFLEENRMWNTVKGPLGIQPRPENRGSTTVTIDDTINFVYPPCNILIVVILAQAKNDKF